MLVVLGAVVPAIAENESRVGSQEVVNELNRMKKQTVVSLAINNPAPASFGVNLSYALNPMIKLEAGTGDATTIFGPKLSAMGAGAIFTYPEWNWTPTAGLHASVVSFSDNGFSSSSINGVGKSGTLVYGSLGMEYQSNSGFNIGLGMNMPFGGMNSTTYISTGWGFDGLKL